MSVFTATRTVYISTNQLQTDIINMRPTEFVSKAPSPTKINDRKITKPLIEKKRRARINASLGELKTLLEAVLGADIPRDSKMEKADILELAVKHLRRVSRGRMNAAAMMDPSVVDKYRVGYSECANEIGRYLTSVNGVNVDLRSRLMDHLSTTMHGSTTVEQKQQEAYVAHNNMLNNNMMNRRRPSPVQLKTPSPGLIVSTPHLIESRKEGFQTTVDMSHVMTPIYVTTTSRPITEHVVYQQPAVMIASPLQSMLTPLHIKQELKHERTERSNVWRPW